MLIYFITNEKVVAGYVHFPEDRNPPPPNPVICDGPSIIIVTPVAAK